jgi:hypothetical protein
LRVSIDLERFIRVTHGVTAAMITAWVVDHSQPRWVD